MGSRLLRLIALIGCIASINAFDSPHFYLAPAMPDEPRFERKLLTSIDVDYSFGITKHSSDGNGTQQELFDLYGPQNIKMLAQGLDTNQDTSLLTPLLAYSDAERFGQISLTSRTKVHRTRLKFTKNLTHGFFVQTALPITAVSTQELSVVDVSANSPTSGAQVEWDALLDQLDTQLANFNLTRAATSTIGLGDLMLLAGWTTNYEETCRLDFIDLSLSAGLLIPTAPQKDIDKLGSFDLGYGGHFGLPLTLEASIGHFDWVTVGMQASIIKLLKSKQNRHVKTDKDQTGVIQLTKAWTHKQPGLVYQIAPYFRADHIIFGFSTKIGYSFTGQRTSKLSGCAQNIDSTILQSDENLKPWSRHTLHLTCEYDFATIKHASRPRLSLSMATQLAGKRVFKSNMYGFGIGCEIAGDW